MNFRFIKNMFAAMILALSFAGSAQAGFIGETVTFELLYPGAGGSVYGSDTDLIANGTVLGPIYGQDAQATFSNSSILFGHAVNACCQWVSSVFYHITGADLDITGVTFDAGASNQGSQGLITFDANNIWIDVGGLIVDQGSYFKLNVSFGNDVPEPLSLSLVAAGLLAAGAFRRRAA